MTIALWCILVAGLLPFVAVAIAKRSPDYDNADPRAWLDRRQGMAKRAVAAQHNSFEAFPFFAAAVLIAHLLAAPRLSSDLLALLFVFARVLYLLAYLGNRATLRSLCWALGLACVIGQFVISA
jgi:uncharacterized MAPEG superfamily protein